MNPHTEIPKHDKTKKVNKFISSIDIDKRLYKYDILGSLAHVKMLQKQKIISKEDGAKIAEGLKKIQAKIEDGSFEFKSELEDVHMNIEHGLIELIGNVGGAMHTARSRNDQVALDTRLYIRDEIIHILCLINTLQKNLISLAEKNIGIMMPGYTHLQHAQPVLFSHHILAYFYKLQRDFERFIDCYERVNINPLGSCALAGTSFNIDRDFVTNLLGFDKPCENSVDGVSDRDFVIETVFCTTTTMMHLSNLTEELILWSSDEFGFIKISDSFTTGSSIMPQKRNLDIAELVRGKTGRVYGNLMALLTLMKGLPLSYNRDMQEDKHPLFDSIDTVKSSLKVLSELLRGIEIKIDNTEIAEALEASFSNATDLADYFTLKGLPFRTAHIVTRKIVSYCIANNKTLRELTLPELNNFSSCNKDIFDILAIDQCINRRTSHGGTSPIKVKESLCNATNILSHNKEIIVTLTISIQKDADALMGKE